MSDTDKLELLARLNEALAEAKARKKAELLDRVYEIVDRYHRMPSWVPVDGLDLLAAMEGIWPDMQRLCDPIMDPVR